MQRITTPSGVLKESPRSSRKDFSESITSHTVGFLNPTARNTFHSLKTRGACYRERTSQSGKPSRCCRETLSTDRRGARAQWYSAGPGEGSVWSLQPCMLFLGDSHPCWGFKVFIYKAEIMMFMISSECNEFTLHKKLLCLHIH